MVSITLSVSEEIRKVMKEHPEINWSGLVRQAIIQRTKEILLKEEMLKEIGKDEEISKWAVELVRKGRKNESSS